VITTAALSSFETPNIYAEINEWTSLGWPEGGAVQGLSTRISPEYPVRILQRRPTSTFFITRPAAAS
jgi:hypothetical protein